MKMTSINLATPHLNYSNSPSTEFNSATESIELMHSKSHNNPICTLEEEQVSEKLNKSELDIEIEMCEELLSSECMESDLTESLNFDKENVSDLSELSDSDSVSTILENYPRKKPKIEVLKESRNVGQCKNFLNCEIESQNDVNITLLSKNCLQNSKKLNEITNDNAFSNEGQPDITPNLSLTELKNMHTTIFDSVINKCKDQLNLPLEGVKIASKTHNAEKQESNDVPLKYTLNEFEEKEANQVSRLSEAEDKSVILECQNVRQCQNIKCGEVNDIPMGENTTLFSTNEFEKKEANILSKPSEAEDKSVILECQTVGQCQNIECEEVNDIPMGENTTLISTNEFEKKEANILSKPSEAEDESVILECQNVGQCQNIECDKVNKIPMGENTTLFFKDCSETSCKMIKNLNDNILIDEGQLSDKVPADSSISVLKEQHSLNVDAEILKCNGEINSLRNIDLANQDIKNNNTVKVPTNDQPLDIVPDFTFPVLENSPSTNLVCDISKCNSQVISSMENSKVNVLKDSFDFDQESNKQCDYKEKDDDELSLLAESDVSTIEEFEMSILDVTDNEHSMSNEHDTFILPSSVKEDKTVSSITVKGPAKKLPEQIKADKEVLLDPKEGKIKHLSTNDAITSCYIEVGDKNTVSNNVHVPEKPSSEADEREDLLDPRWDKIKELSTDEERYQQVKNCWKCAKVPDPNKNLTYHSFRKRHFKNATVDQPKQRKRMASNNLNEHSAKRSRSCTFHLDNQILTVSAKEKQETERIMLEMNNEISRVNRSFEQELQRQNNPNRGYNFGQLQVNLENKIASIRSQYSQQANHCINKVESEIHALNVARNEVLQFYKFYKGLNSRNDPTVLTFEQNLELEEIENVYSKFDQLYSKW